MTDFDMLAFRGVMVDLQRTFRYRASELEFGEMIRNYFDALQAYEVAEVRKAALAHVQRGRTFPKVSDLIKLLPRRTPRPAAVPEMTEEELVTYRLAKEAGWQGEPCRCAECVAAGVDRFALRYVPDVNPDGSDRYAIDPTTKQAVVTGHWLHGLALSRWYAERHHLFAWKPPATASKATQDRLAPLLSLVKTLTASEHEDDAQPPVEKL